jgi:hypothetical protein
MGANEPTEDNAPDIFVWLMFPELLVAVELVEQLSPISDERRASGLTMPAHVQLATGKGEPLLIQFYRETRLVEEKTAGDGLDAVRVLVLLVAGIETLRDGDVIKVKRT